MIDENRKSVFLILVLLFCFLSVGCKKQSKLSLIKVGMTMDQVNGILGRPQTQVNGTGGHQTECDYEDGGDIIQVFYDNDIVIEIKFWKGKPWFQPGIS